MKIDQGLFSKMVLQRTADNVAQNARILGRCSAVGIVTASVTQNGQLVKGWESRVIGNAAKGKFSASLAGLPVGGSYEVTLSICNEKVSVSDVLVGDVWVLAGQSNMQGHGLHPQKRLPLEPQVRAFYMDDRWDTARDPLHNLFYAVDTIHHNICGKIQRPMPPYIGEGPGVAFGQKILAHTAVPQGLIACAHGGTAIAQWDPKLKKLGTASLYGATFRRLDKNYPGGKIAGILWYQGCNDCGDDTSRLYMERTKDLIRAFRRDLRQPDLPFVIVQLARVTRPANDDADDSWNRVREAQRLIGIKMKNVRTVPVIDLDLDDEIHLSGTAQKICGERCAEAMESIRLAGAENAPQPPIELKSISIGKTRANATVVTLTYKNVIGVLESKGLPSGFLFQSDSLNKRFVAPCRIDLDGNKVLARLASPPSILKHDILRAVYGYGCNPYCNITDSAGRSLPAFGPIPAGRRYKTVSDFATLKNVRVSDFIATKRDLSDLTDVNLATIKWLEDSPLNPKSENWCDMHNAICTRPPAEEAVIFGAEFICDRAHKLRVLLGYDGPVRVWIDGQEVFYDPQGFNPAFADKSSFPFDATKGRHQVIVALSSNLGKAWGIFLRLQRINIKASEIKNRDAPEFPKWSIWQSV